MTDSLVFAVALEAPEEVQVAGRRWFRRPEFHVTTFNPDDLAAATGVDAQKLAKTVALPTADADSVLAGLCPSAALNGPAAS